MLELAKVALEDYRPIGLFYSFFQFVICVNLCLHNVNPKNNSERKDFFKKHKLSVNLFNSVFF